MAIGFVLWPFITSHKSDAYVQLDSVRKTMLSLENICQLDMASQLGTIVCVHFSFSGLAQNFSGAAHVESLFYAIPWALPSSWRNNKSH